MVTGIKNSTVVVVILIEDTKRHKRRTHYRWDLNYRYLSKESNCKELKNTNKYTHKKCRNIREKL